MSDNEHKKIWQANEVEAQILKSVNEIKDSTNDIKTDVAVLTANFNNYVKHSGDKINAHEKRIEKIETKVEGLKEWAIKASALTAGIVLGLKWAFGFVGAK